MENGISLASILHNLKTKFIGRNILYYPSVASTMDVARKMAENGAREGMVVIADEQTAGRGRMGREWLSPRGSLSLSIILCPTMAQLSQLNMVASLAVVQSIEKVTGLKPTVKWPNDILINKRKVSGILIENIFHGSNLSASIVGIGININLKPEAFPQISAIATSLSTESRRVVHRGEILLSLLEELEQLYQGLRRGKPIYERWLSHVETLGKEVKVRSGEKVEEGYVESINADGSLVLRRHDGSSATLVAGEVTLHI